MKLISSFLFILLAAGPGFSADPSEVLISVAKPPVRTEVVRLSSGAELITFFEKLPEGLDPGGHTEMPVMAVLKDTLDDSDPSNDRVRQVWVFTYSQPSILQRAAGGVPFLYHRAGLDLGPGSKPPKAVLDLGDPSHGMWTGLALTGAQSEVLNPIGAIARLTTHSFFGNYGEYRQTHAWEAGDVVSARLSDLPDSTLTAQQMQAVEERIELTGHPLGGLVADEYLERDHEKLRARQTETRGHNWDLLRQRAEDAGLYVQPVESDGLPGSFALLWVAQPDLEGPARKFDRQFLNISNPFTDERLRQWEGYSETWDLDRDSVAATPDSPDARPVRMIPLALYALDHPRTPLLLVDFRGSGHPQRREMGLKLAEDITSGVLGFTGYGNLGYVALKSSWMFIHTRHGGATNRSARRRAFVTVRHAIGSDSNLDPDLRTELLSRIEKVDVNPIERSWNQEVRDSWRQYDALIAYARETGLAREIDRDRGDEVRAAVHGPAARTFLRIATISTAGLYRHHEKMDEAAMAKLNQQRRDALAKLQIRPLPPTGDSVALIPKAIPIPAKSGIEP